MAIAEFRARVLSGELLAGTFMKTPSVDILEVLILSGLDFVCIDAEHAPFDRAALNTCLAVARASDFPVVVRVACATPDDIGGALDLGAVGVVVPHVTTAQSARGIATASRFGHGGRGYAGSTRWAGFGGASMAALLKKSRTETLVIAQIEDPEGVTACEEIAATDGVDALFLGPADLSVAYGKTDQTSPELDDARARVGAAAQAHSKAYMTFTPDAAASKALMQHGFTVFFVASEHTWIRQGVARLMSDLKD